MNKLLLGYGNWEVNMGTRFVVQLADASDDIDVYEVVEDTTAENVVEDEDK